MTRSRARNEHLLSEHLSLYDPAVQSRIQEVADLPPRIATTLQIGAPPEALAFLGTVQQQVGIMAFLDSFRVLGWLFLVMIPLAFLMRRPRYE